MNITPSHFVDSPFAGGELRYQLPQKEIGGKTPLLERRGAPKGRGGLFAPPFQRRGQTDQ